MTNPNERDTCQDYVLPLLDAAGWAGKFTEQDYFTDGRIIPTGRSHRRNEGKLTDYLLKHLPHVPIAVIEAKREWSDPRKGLQQAMEYAEILGLPFAYATNGKGIVEHDFVTGHERDQLKALPTPAELWQRWRPDFEIKDDQVVQDALHEYCRDLRDATGRVLVPRFYQRIAIDRAVRHVLRGRQRMLICMATGTGKTFVASQIVWKLWKTHRRKRILYLADRDFLVDQPYRKEFSIFGDALQRIQGKAAKSRDVYFALYQSIADDATGMGLYRDYPPDFFDLIIVDECHRGSAREHSTWRKILDYFTSAAQIGMTATPKRTDNVDTYEYFGNPIYTYTLKDGIDDGFLAPFRVHRVVPSVDATGWRPSAGQLDRFRRLVPDKVYQTPDFERKVALLGRTEAIARHLTRFMKANDGRLDKTIIFCVDQEHAADMRLALINLNADIVKEHPNYVVRITADELDVGKAHYEDFEDLEKQYPVIATTSQLLTTGIDIQTVKNIVIVKPIGSMVEFKQIIGRGTRLSVDRGKVFFNILDYSGATNLFEDAQFDGMPDQLGTEEIDEKGDPIKGPAQGQVAQPPGPPSAARLPLLKPGPNLVRRKLYVDGTPVEICAEVVYELDPQGRQVKPVQFIDYSGKQVRTLWTSADALRSKWSSAEERAAVVEALERRGVSLDQLAEVTRRPDAEALDLLIHVAWGTAPKTRRERADRVKHEHRAFFAKFQPEARQILEQLVEKYAELGVRQLEDLQILEVPPLSALGTPVELVRRFGGKKELVDALGELQKLIYAA